MFINTLFYYILDIFSGIQSLQSTHDLAPSLNIPDGLSDERPTLYIGGLFELRDEEGVLALSAAQMAVNDINDQGIVSGMILKLVWNDTQASL